jgi:hypothetical protein
VFTAQYELGLQSRQLHFRPERVKQLAQANASCNLFKGSEEIFSLMKMRGKITVFRDVIPCSLVEMYQRVGGSCDPKLRIQE